MVMVKCVVLAVSVALAGCSTEASAPLRPVNLHQDTYYRGVQEKCYQGLVEVAKGLTEEQLDEIPDVVWVSEYWRCLDANGATI